MAGPLAWAQWVYRIMGEIMLLPFARDLLRIGLLLRSGLNEAALRRTLRVREASDIAGSRRIQE